MAQSNRDEHKEQQRKIQESSQRQSTAQVEAQEEAYWRQGICKKENKKELRTKAYQIKRSMLADLRSMLADLRNSFQV